MKLRRFDLMKLETENVKNDGYILLNIKINRPKLEENEEERENTHRICTDDISFGCIHFSINSKFVFTFQFEEMQIGSKFTY